MEAFRRALQRACTYSSFNGTGAGASVDYTFIENRRHSDGGLNLRKGSLSTTMASSSVFWAIPKVGSESKNIVMMKVNDDELFEDAIGMDLASQITSKLPSMNVPIIGSLTPTVGIKSIDFGSDTVYTETFKRDEDTAGIKSRRDSNLKDTLTTTINYTIVPGSLDIDRDNLPSFGHTVKQYLYRDAQGQYRYSRYVPEEYSGAKRGKQWETSFSK
jgi:hypothetical protein